MGLTNWLKPTDNGHWEMNPETGIARRTEKLASTELETCAACHSRRKVIAKNPMPGEPFLDAYLPALLEPGLYHADGQIDGEVYEYGSFLQSRMHAAGVTCSNCHDPHSAKLRAEGNALCAQCHLPAKFDVAEHHHHQPGSAGAQCVNCHMPTKNYMVVDARRDHSIRVPRPDLSVSLGTPNACTQCHADRSAQWAAETVAGWYPGGRQTTPHYGTALHAGRIGAADAEQQLDRLILDQSQPAIARASALPLLTPYASPASEPAIKAAIADPDPLVRMAAPRALPGTPPPRFVHATAPLLSDPVRAVRIEAARALAGTDLLALTPEQQTALVKATAELVAAEMVDADRPEAHLNLGLLDLRRRELPEAESGIPHGAASRPEFRPGPGQPRRSRPGARHGRRGGGTPEEGDGDRARQCRCPLCPRSLPGAPARLRRGAGSAAPRARADARQCALRLCLCRRAELDRQRRERRWRSWKRRISSIRRIATS